MATDLAWIDGLILLGAGQGLFVAALLLTRKPISLPNKLLGILMAAFSVDLFMAVCYNTGLAEQFTGLIGIDFPLAFSYGPLLYLYTRTLSKSESRLRSRDYLHFVPLALAVLIVIPVLLMSPGDKIALMNGLDAGWLAATLGGLNQIKIVHATCYVLALLILLRQHRKRIRNRYSSTEKISLNWLRAFVYGVVVLVLVSIGVVLLSPGQPVSVGMDVSTHYDEYLLLLLSIFVYAVGFGGLKQQPVEIASNEIMPVPRENPKPYAKSGLSDDDCHRLADRLIRSMSEDHLYRDSALSLPVLAEKLNIPQHNLSEVLNRAIGRSFYDFVNGYRVDEVKQKLRSGEAARLTILAVALEAGFNSKSSFNAIFKKVVGKTPSQYRQEVEPGQKKRVSELVE